MLRDLEIVKRYMERVTCKSKDKYLKSNSFCAEANLLCGSILKLIDAFGRAVGDLHDRSGKT
jgi:hypothetical protein